LVFVGIWDGELMGWVDGVDAFLMRMRLRVGSWRWKLEIVGGDVIDGRDRVGLSVRRGRVMCYARYSSSFSLYSSSRVPAYWSVSDVLQFSCDASDEPFTGFQWRNTLRLLDLGTWDSLTTIPRYLRQPTSDAELAEVLYRSVHTKLHNALSPIFMLRSSFE